MKYTSDSEVQPVVENVSEVNLISFEGEKPSILEKLQNLSNEEVKELGKNIYNLLATEHKRKLQMVLKLKSKQNKDTPSTAGYFKYEYSLLGCCILLMDFIAL